MHTGMAVIACPMHIAPCARGTETGIGTNYKPSGSKFCGVVANLRGCLVIETLFIEAMCQIKKPIPPII
jgi:hypothetical protein